MNRAMTDMIELEMLMREDTEHKRGGGVRRQITRLRRTIPAPLLEKFDHLQSRGRHPVSMLSESGACGNCHLKLTASAVQIIRSSVEAIHRCPHCDCFIYMAGAADAPHDLISLT